MRKLLVVLACLALLSVAAKPAPSGSIALAPGSDARLGGTVNFVVTTSNLPGNANPRVQVLCYQSGALVYGEAYNVGTAFLLGGGWSRWLERGGPADCHADLYYWDFHPTQVFNWLAGTDFAASG